MSPERSSRSSSSSNPKPYSKGSSSADKQLQSTEIAHSKPAKADQAGFPSYAHYLQIEDKYVASLSAMRRPKALINQDMFDRIWDILHNPNKVTENASFKFWVRKKFSLGTVSQPHNEHAASFGPESQSLVPPARLQIVLLHNGNLVAVQDQIYEILCFSHGLSDHAGRDRTMAVLKRHYTWIPKELVAQFIKACPTCIGKKSGLTGQRKAKEAEENLVKPNNLKDRKGKKTMGPLMGDLLNNVPMVRHTQSEDTSGNSGAFTIMDTGSRSGSSGSSGSGSITMFAGASANVNMNAGGDKLNIETDMDRNEAHSAPSRLELASGYPLDDHLRSLPMSREVSLFQGIPNGWQFHHADYAEAHDAFLKLKGKESEVRNIGVPRNEQGRKNVPAMVARLARNHPRIPSVAPMVRTLDENYDEDDDEEVGKKATGYGGPPIPRTSGMEPHHEFQIDPVLLSLPQARTQVHAASSPRLTPFPAYADPNFSGPVPAPSFHRAAPPPAIDLGSLSSQDAIHGFLKFRESTVESPGTPLVDVSPGSSAGSQYSCGSGGSAGILSPFEVLMSATSSASTAGTGMVVTPRDDDGVGTGFGKRSPEEMRDKEKLQELVELATEMVRLGEVKVQGR